jgi:hypothetical protein
MKQVKLFFATTILSVCFIITTSCSQAPRSKDNSVTTIFQASTPCDDVSKALLEIPTDFKCDWMKWNLTVYQDQKNPEPATYKLVCVYGLPRQGSREFLPGSKTLELSGKCTIMRGLSNNANAVVYKLTSPDSHIALSFLKLDQNLLHLLDEKDQLMVGNGGFSYTLNRINPVKLSSVKFSSESISVLPIITDSATIGLFDGRTPCISIPRELNGITADGCQITKWRLTLYQDPKTHTPTTFQIYTVYVGKGNSRYTNTGKWGMTRGTKTDPSAIVYELILDSDKPQSLTFLKGDDNILYFLDKDMNFMVGDNYTSFTLNRAKK